ASRTLCIPRTGNAAHLNIQIWRFFAKHPAPFWPIIKSGTLRRLPLSAQHAREKLSGSAAALFQRFGYARVSIRDITSAVDIPKGAFYNHFKSKEAIASAVLSL